MTNEHTRNHEATEHLKDIVVNDVNIQQAHQDARDEKIEFVSSPELP